MLSANKVQKLVFRHLYDDKWGVIMKASRSWEKDKIIMPSDFQPITGQSYNCHVQATFSGVFHWQGKNYDLYFAKLVDAGSVIDIFDYKFVKVRKVPSLNPLTEALRAVKIDKSELPLEHEIVVIEVEPNKKNGSLMFKPQYNICDPVVDGRPSMTFFNRNDSNKFELASGQRWRARVLKKEKTGKTNQMGHIIVNANIILLTLFSR
jgi:hypothetical protein